MHQAPWRCSLSQGIWTEHSWLPKQSTCFPASSFIIQPNLVNGINVARGLKGSWSIPSSWGGSQFQVYAKDGFIYIYISPPCCWLLQDHRLEPIITGLSPVDRDYSRVGCVPRCIRQTGRKNFNRMFFRVRSPLLLEMNKGAGCSRYAGSHVVTTGQVSLRKKPAHKGGRQPDESEKWSWSSDCLVPRAWTYLWTTYSVR